MEILEIGEVEIGSKIDCDCDGDVFLDTGFDLAYINKDAAIKIIKHLDEVFDLGMVKKG